jgi:hypothetical protein
MTNSNSFERLLSVAVLGFLIGQPNANAQDNQFGQDVRTFCSQHEFGQFHFWECDSTVSYIDPADSQIFYCKGFHLVVTAAGKVHTASVRAECTLTFAPYSESDNFTLLDLTKDGVPEIPRTKKDLYPDGVAWIAARNLREIQFCSQFTAGQAGIQNRCIAATFK